jgi:hypothetical protein
MQLRKFLISFGLTFSLTSILNLTLLFLSNSVHADPLKTSCPTGVIVGEIYIWDSYKKEVIGCLSCGSISQPLSMSIQRYINKFNGANRSPCNPETNGTASLQTYIGSGNWRFEGKFTANVEANNGICNAESSYYWKDVCEKLYSHCK